MSHPRTVLLVGGGHAHLHVVRHARRFHRRGIRVVLVDPGDFWYSGLATGVLAGHVPPACGRIRLAALAQQHEVDHLQDRLLAVDARRRIATLERAGAVSFAALSLNVGSAIDAPDWGTPPDTLQIWPVKPIPELHAFRACLVADCSGGHVPRVCVVGGGATGCELAAAVAARVQQHGGCAQITLLTRGPRVLPGLPDTAAQSVADALRAMGVVVRTHAPVAGWAERGVRLDDGSLIEPDHVLLATGLRAQPVVRGLGLAASDAGLRTNACLQSVSSPTVFAVGDCADFGPRRLPKLGVFGVRASPVLCRNLLATVTGKPLRSYRPQRVWLSILNLGGKTGLLTWGPVWWLGRGSLWFKLWLDRRFVRRYQRQP